MKGKIILERAYDLDPDLKGKRVLVDRLWPRGIKKESLEPFSWEKDLAPSNDLRKSFNHEVSRFDDFKEKYLKELEANDKAKDFKKKAQDILKEEDLILLYGAKDKTHNQAVVLKAWLGA